MQPASDIWSFWDDVVGLKPVSQVDVIDFWIFILNLCKIPIMLSSVLRKEIKIQTRLDYTELWGWILFIRSSLQQKAHKDKQLTRVLCDIKGGQ